MMWSEKELASFSLVSANVIVERVYKYIDAPDNIDIFNEDNFSYLWGMLGVAGIKGIPLGALNKVWKALKDNNIIAAFDKGVLGDFNNFLISKYEDNRLCSWKGLDNFLADQKFKKMILMPIVAINRDYAHEVDMQAFNPVRVLGVLERYPLSVPVKQMLVDMQGHGAACGISGKEVVECYEKEKVLTRLCDIIAHSKRKLEEYEKDFFFRYIQNAVLDGFNFGLIGVNDLVFEKLMADETDDSLSELELVPLRERNAEIVEFAKKFDEEYGFFELSAAKLIKNNPLNIPGMIERCLSLIEKTDPKGVVFALELVNLKQLRSAAKILIALARKGRATELASFLHRLLPDANGSEMMIMSILKLNLKMLKERELFSLDDVFREYPARLYIMGIKQFIEYGFYKEAATLLSELVEDGWIEGFEDLRVSCCEIVKMLIGKNKDIADSMQSVATIIKLEKHAVEDAKDNECLADEIQTLDNIDYDVKSVADKISVVEEFTHNIISGIKNPVTSDEGGDKKYENEVENYEDEALGLLEDMLDDEEYIKNDVVENDVGYISENILETKNDVKDDSDIKIDIVEDIKSWNENNDIDSNEEDIKYDNILNIDEKEIENHFEKIKNLATSVIEKAEQKTSEIMKKIDEFDVENPKGLDKLKKLKEKITFFKKK